MPDKFEEIVREIPIKQLDMLRKDIEKYKENVNKCNISMIDSLSFDIGSRIDYLKFALKIIGEQRRQAEVLEEEYKRYSDKVRQCQCVRKLPR